MGRVAATQSESQFFADTAALASAGELDENPTITRSHDRRCGQSDCR